MLNQNTITESKLNVASRSAFLALFWEVADAHETNESIAPRWEKIRGRIAELEAKIGPQHFPLDLGFGLLRSTVRARLCELDGLGADWTRRPLIAHSYLQPGFWRGLERSGRIWADSEEWRGTVAELLDASADPRNALTASERRKIQLGPTFVRGILAGARGEFGPGLVDYTKVREFA